ncbi:hypothetical protein Gpo141_00002368 [Globisporangium polare]
MRAPPTAVAPVEQALQQFLQQEDAYLLQLERVESDFAKKLRFQSPATSSPSPRTKARTLHEQFEIGRFVNALAQLRHLHRVFNVRLHDLTSFQASGAVLGRNSGFEAKLVDVLDDLLAVVRFQYGQLFCDAEATQALLEQVRGGEANSGAILHSYLAKEGIAVEELVMRSLHRFHAIVEFVEVLSSLCTDSALVQRLLHLAISTRDYIHAVQSESRDEQDLIALQAQVIPSAICPQLDLSAEKLFLRGETRFVALRDATDAVNVSYVEALYAHCFSSGKLLYSKREASIPNGSTRAKQDSSSDRFAIQGSLELKQDPVFFECVPDAVLQQGDAATTATVNGAIALLSSQESIVLGFEDAAIAQQWSATSKSLLSQNETRTQVLRSQRSFTDIQIPPVIATQLRHDKKSESLVPFPFFHDDDLPGVFWLESVTGGRRSWELVELMFYDKWLLVSKVLGWKRQTLLHHINCRDSTIDIRDEPSGENDWSLVITASGAQELKLVSKRRSRIDFWFDQISKAVVMNTQDDLVDSEVQREQLSYESIASATSTNEQRFISARAKRGKGSVVAVAVVAASNAIASTKATSASAKKTTKKRKSSGLDQKEEASGAAGTPATKKKAKTKKARSKIDSLIQVAEDALEGDEHEFVATGEAKEPQSARKAPPPMKHDVISRLQSPAIKTPKRRWLKLKSEDPDDSILLDTDVSQDTTVDETTSNDARTSQSQNARSTIRIILTGLEPTPAIRKKIKAVGTSAVYEDDIERATHVIAPKNQLKRTVKLLCGISRCDHILDEKWLDDSAKASAPLSEQDYCLLDTNAQEKWHFDLHKTMYEFTPEQRRQLFVGHTVFITNHKSVLPPVKDLVKIVECAGGKAEVKGSAGPSDLVITSEAALGVASVQKSLAQANPQRIYSPELILSSILQQHIDFDLNHLELPTAASSTSSRKRRSA